MGEPFNAVDIIKTKRDGDPLTSEQIAWVIDAYTKGSVEHEQMSALLMAIVWRGLSAKELAAWTNAMIESGERLDLASIDLATADKHSTGGVGDKISLILAPVVAACGVAVPMLSGRGLGHTGGTLDKLESIPGFRSDLDSEAMLEALRAAGCVISAAGGALAPADRKLYRLRDITGTVESIPLIASSIMSKKIAEGTDALVLDVKVGSGAFLPDLDDARELARTMVGIGREHEVKTTAVLTDMEAPLGRAVGNALEVTESLEVLDGGGPQDLIDVTLALAQVMLELVGVDADPAATLNDGSARERLETMVAAQGGDLSKAVPVAETKEDVAADGDGYVATVDARAIGEAAWRLGAGRARMEDPVSATAGVLLHKKPGDTVNRGETMLELHLDDRARLPAALDALEDAVTISAEPPPERPLIIDRIDP